MFEAGTWREERDSTNLGPPGKVAASEVGCNPTGEDHLFVNIYRHTNSPNAWDWF